MVVATFGIVVLLGLFAGGVFLIRRKLGLSGPTQSDLRQQEQFKIILEREMAMLKKQKHQKPLK